MIETARCTWCRSKVYLNPFVGEWQTSASSVCSDAPGAWKLHQPILLYGPDEVIDAIGDILSVVA